MDCAQKILDPQTASFKLAKEGFCAYEALKMILSKVQVFLGTYHYTFNPPVRKSLLQSWGVDLSDVYLIVDEAHNISDFSRDLLSDRISPITLENALKETEKFEHANQGDVQDFLNVLDDEVFRYVQKEMGSSNLKLLDQKDLTQKFQEWSGASNEEVAKIFHEYGEYVKQVRQEEGYDRRF